MTEQLVDVDVRLTLAKDLVIAIESGDEKVVDELLCELAGVRETMLFQEVGRLTRQLHNTMANFSVDSKLSEMTEKDIPDAKERLSYVIATTEQAANQTLTVVEELMPLSRELNEQSHKLAENWGRFLLREMPYQEFKGMSQEITDYFNYSVASLETMQNGLNDVLLAQGFQDITGQIIRRVIELVQDLEGSMVELIRISGGKARKEVIAKEPKLPGPVVPGVDDTTGDVASSQDEVDDLLSSLGF
jgi:chemotaxis protein CheZ